MSRFDFTREAETSKKKKNMDQLNAPTLENSRWNRETI